MSFLLMNGYLLRPLEMGYLTHNPEGEHSGVVVEHQTLNQEALGSIPTGGTMFSP